MVEVFRTNVNKIKPAKQILSALLEIFPGSKISFDLQDCDRILRIETKGNLHLGQVISIVQHHRFECEILPG